MISVDDCAHFIYVNICDLVCAGSLSAEIEATQLNVSMEEFNKLLKEYQQIFPESA
jgi:hypothetical protein